MKNVLLNLYNRGFFTFYIILITTDMLSVFIFRIPLITLAVAFLLLIFASLDIAKKFKK